MKLFPRATNRNKVKILKDVRDSEKVTRDDIYDLVKDCTTLDEATKVVQDFLQPISEGLKSFKGDKVRAIANIISDLRSYKDFDVKRG